VVVAHGYAAMLSTAESMIDIHDNVDRNDSTRKKKKRLETAEKGRNEKKGVREAKKHRAAMAVWSHRYPAELRDPRSASAYRSLQTRSSSLWKSLASQDFVDQENCHIYAFFAGEKCKEL